MAIWRAASFFAGEPASALRNWLVEPGSLTARLKRRGEFHLTLLRQGAFSALPDERRVLGLAPRAPCQIREVLLSCAGLPVVFAHTALPSSPRSVLDRWFAGLATRSLGSLLFTHPGFRHGELHFARLDARHPLFAPARQAFGALPPAAPRFLYARRCAHHFRSQIVLVTEVFSPLLATLGEDGAARASA